MHVFEIKPLKNAPFFCRAIGLASLLCLALLVGCDVGAAVRAARDKAREQKREASEKATAAAFAAVTEEESLRLAVKIDSAVAAGDASDLTGDFDLDAFIALILQQPGYEGANADSFARGFKQGGVTGDDFLRKLVAEASSMTIPDGDYHRLRIHERDGRSTALFRLLGNDARLNYHEFAFNRGADGRARIADVYVYATGEWMSQTVGRAMIAALGPLKERMSKDEEDAVDRRMADLKKATALAKESDSEGLDALVATMSPEMQREKFVIVLQIGAAALDEKRMIPHADRLAKLYPDDPATFLMCSDRYFVEQRYDEALAMIDKLAAHVGGDPYLSAYRAELLCYLDRLPEARASALTAYEADPSRDPGLDAAYSALANVAVLEGDFDETASWIRELAELRQIPATYARDYVERDFPAWDDFRESDAWRKLAKE